MIRRILCFLVIAGIGCREPIKSFHWERVDNVPHMISYAVPGHKPCGAVMDWTGEQSYMAFYVYGEDGILQGKFDTLRNAKTFVEARCKP